MHPGFLFGSLGEEPGERGSVVPGLPLIHVIRTEEISCLTGDQVQRGLVEVRKIHRHALRGPMRPGDGFDRVSATRLRLETRTRPILEHRDVSEDRMLDLDRVVWSPPPRGEVFRC